MIPEYPWQEHVLSIAIVFSNKIREIRNRNDSEIAYKRHIPAMAAILSNLRRDAQILELIRFFHLFFSQENQNKSEN